MRCVIPINASSILTGNLLKAEEGGQHVALVFQYMETGRLHLKCSLNLCSMQCDDGVTCGAAARLVAQRVHCSWVAQYVKYLDFLRKLCSLP